MSDVKYCEHCGGPFYRASVGQRFERQRFCSNKCKGAALNKPISLEEKFWANVEKPNDQDSCWRWGGHLNKGYGQIHNGIKAWKAHRASYVINVGPIPDGMCVLHRCDNPECTNPRHLFLGTQLDNLKDMAAKKRGKNGNLKGSDVGNSKLTESDVLEIRQAQDSQSSLARRFGVGRSTIFRIRKEQAWRHI